MTSDKDVKKTLNGRPMNRRDFIEYIGVSTATTFIPRLGRGSSQTHRRPNIILIMADDLGFECLGSYGGTS